MKEHKEETYGGSARKASTAALLMLAVALLMPFNIFSSSLAGPADPVAKGANLRRPVKGKHPVVTPPRPDSIALKSFPDSLFLTAPVEGRTLVEGDSLVVSGDSTILIPEGALPVDTCVNCVADSLAALRVGDEVDPDYVVREFFPDPTRAVWLSALCPGLGQLYNRRYWKLPIVVGGFMGLTYGMTWNNNMLTDYTQAYRDLMDNDPNTKSYMDFYPPGTDESQLNKSWLEKTFQSRKNFFRRNRDLCIISMGLVYLVAMADAYVDASLSHFDISPDLSVDVAPAVIPDTRGGRPGLGLHWAFTF